MTAQSNRTLPAISCEGRSFQPTPQRLVMLHGVDHNGPDPLVLARAHELESCGWAVELVAVEQDDDRLVPVGVDRVDLAGLLQDATDVEIWTGDTLALVTTTEMLWHNGAITTLIVREEGLKGLLENNPAAQVITLRDLAEAVRYSDCVVALDEISASALVSAGVSGVRKELPINPPPYLSAATSIPSLTVLVTTFERPSELRACLTALTGQSLPKDHFDVVIIDDGSSTPTEEVVAEFRDRLRLNLLLLPENVGLGEARNIGVRLATGDVTLLMDDDDVPALRCLEEHVLAHAREPDENLAILGFTGLQAPHGLDAVGRHVTSVGMQYFAYAGMEDGRVLDWRGFWGGRSSVKTSLLKRIGFRARFLEDAEFAYRARTSGFVTRYCRRASQSVASRLDLRQFARRQVRMGRARSAFAHQQGHRTLIDGIQLSRQAEVISQWMSERALLTNFLESSLNLPLSRLRRQEHPSEKSSGRLLEMVDSALGLHLAAAHAVGLFSGALLEASVQTGRPLTLAIDADDCDLLAVLTALAGQTRVQAVISVASDELAAPLLERLETELSAFGVQSRDLPDVELRVGGGHAWQLNDADVVTQGSMGATWCVDQPLPLIGQPTLDWLEQLTSDDGMAGTLR